MLPWSNLYLIKINQKLLVCLAILKNFNKKLLSFFLHEELNFQINFEKLIVEKLIFLTEHPREHAIKLTPKRFTNSVSKLCYVNANS